MRRDLDLFSTFREYSEKQAVIASACPDLKNNKYLSGPAFADFAPGLAPFDWLIGIVGAAGFRLLIYFKSKNAKKFRRDEEYGSARWSA